MTRTFFSKKRAESFAASLKGFESVKIWRTNDAFKQLIYVVQWY